MAASGVSSIDDLLAGRAQTVITPGSDDADAVGLIQDLLIGHGFNNLPNVLGLARGKFGPDTTAAVRAFQTGNGLAGTGAVDLPTLQKMLSKPATHARCSRPYLTLVLNVLFTDVLHVMTLTTLFEGGGRFGALNLNTDGAGLSYGLIQWAQKPGRLNELLIAFETDAPALFVEVFGSGDSAGSNGLIVHTARLRGGTNDAGETTDAAFDLIREPWITRFGNAAVRPEFQRIQVNTALAAFMQSWMQFQSLVPQVRSQRGIGFLLDVANQHGDGGLKNILAAVSATGRAEADLLTAVEAESVARVRAKFGDGKILDSTRNRRHAFLTTTLLSDAPLLFM
jgi:peptidoglycan hydrolase-like protein with peptidoglycan-binding domain